MVSLVETDRYRSIKKTDKYKIGYYFVKYISYPDKLQKDNKINVQVSNIGDLSIKFAYLISTKALKLTSETLEL